MQGSSPPVRQVPCSRSLPSASASLNCRGSRTRRIISNACLERHSSREWSLPILKNCTNGPGTIPPCSRTRGRRSQEYRRGGQASTAALHHAGGAIPGNPLALFGFFQGRNEEGHLILVHPVSFSRSSSARRA